MYFVILLLYPVYWDWTKNVKHFVMYFVHNKIIVYKLQRKNTKEKHKDDHGNDDHPNQQEYSNNHSSFIHQAKENRIMSQRQ